MASQRPLDTPFIVPVFVLSTLGAMFLGACEPSSPPVDPGHDPNSGGANSGGTSSGGEGGSAGGGMGGTGGMGGSIEPGCSTDSDCLGKPTGNVCDPNTGTCVQCTPQNDPCPQGQFCNAMNNQCDVGCNDDTDCVSMNELHCDLSLNACAGCLMDEHCPPGSVCNASLCVPGCNAAQSCQSGFTCCDSTCHDIQNDVQHCGNCSSGCDELPNASVVCQDGVCNLGACQGVWNDCDGNPSNGCERNTLADGPCVCTPGHTKNCYFAPPETLGVGPCKTGTQTCDSDGLSWGTCVGQVMPTSELDNDFIDQDCNGLVDDVPPEPMSIICPEDPFMPMNCPVDGEVCVYGQECCCGVCDPSIWRECFGGLLSGHYTDACLGVTCTTPPPPVIQVDDYFSGTFTIDCSPGAPMDPVSGSFTAIYDNSTNAQPVSLTVLGATLHAIHHGQERFWRFSTDPASVILNAGATMSLVHAKVMDSGYGAGPGPLCDYCDGAWTIEGEWLVDGGTNIKYATHILPMQCVY